MDDENEDTEKKSISKKLLVGASSSVVAFTSVVFAYIDSKTSNIDKRIEDKYTMARDYVDSRHMAVQAKLDNIEKLLIKIDDRVYEIKKTQGGK